MTSSSISGRQPQAVRSALAILEEVAAAGVGITAKEISTALRIPPATTYRLLNLLVAEEYLVRLPDLGGFALGRRSANLAPSSVAAPTAARQVMRRLRDRVRWGAHLVAFDRHRLTFLDPDPDHPPTDADELSRHPHASGLGRLLLAEHGLPDGPLTRLTPDTVVDRDELARRLDEVRETGLARQCGEFHATLGCLAVAVRAPDDRRLVAGLALTGPAERVAAPNTELVDLLHAHAGDLAPLLA
ncbi:IclR family transcriptional regulator [Actinomycetospora lemnae]|uniref:IclR family transcriptional regulator C-terminal domain-containing protein n=1 Tax=Actinomycetospora lemnae TaxID=3019891 RepID=A0ABT5SWW4_9PSEU|nr:IclR family transcriptional regulator C-terminal domain-containing protein [Actinomycetospora sp. DW7H6]MDD7966631.1 IclR family transcriptional regulator C-terminal domain-containing protein [Actinomycetospora sp. DW7H6]